MADALRRRLKGTHEVVPSMLPTSALAVLAVVAPWQRAPLRPALPTPAAVAPETAGLSPAALDQVVIQSVETADPAEWRAMFEVNVLGTLQVTQALLPALRASGDAVIVNVGSTAGRIAYEGGGGYTAAKHGLKVLTQTLRLELVAEPLRFTEIAPGMVRTEEFGLVRFEGDESKRDAVYQGVKEPLVAEDIAEAVRWVASLPAHVDLDEIVVRPRAQAAQHKVHRES